MCNAEFKCFIKIDVKELANIKLVQKIKEKVKD